MSNFSVETDEQTHTNAHTYSSNHNKIIIYNTYTAIVSEYTHLTLAHNFPSSIFFLYVLALTVAGISSIQCDCLRAFYTAIISIIGRACLCISQWFTWFKVLALFEETLKIDFIRSYSFVVHHYRFDKIKWCVHPERLLALSLSISFLVPVCVCLCLYIRLHCTISN